MSYDISLHDPVTKEVLLLDEPHQMKGGTFAVGGTIEASINVTYNYAEIFQRAFENGSMRLDEYDLIFGRADSGIRSLYGKTGAEALPTLEAAIAQLSGDTDPDYWKATEGNAKKALCSLRALCQMRPDGVINGD